MFHIAFIPLNYYLIHIRKREDKCGMNIAPTNETEFLMLSFYDMDKICHKVNWIKGGNCDYEGWGSQVKSPETSEEVSNYPFKILQNFIWWVVFKAHIHWLTNNFFERNSQIFYYALHNVFHTSPVNTIRTSR